MSKLIVICLECGRERQHAGRGLCKACYERLRNQGNLDRFPRTEKPFEEWLSMIDRNDPLACWIWPGPKASNGYGTTSRNSAHREAYLRNVGPIAPGLTIDHRCCWESGCVGGLSCPHRPCVNWVNHLEAVTNTINQLRSPHTLAGQNARKARCPKDHLYTEENTYMYQGHRTCRECRRNY